MTTTLWRRVRPGAIATLVLLACSAGAHAQPASNAGPGVPQVVSPEVAADRRVTFRLFAPNALTVTLHGDFFREGVPGPALTKDAAGVWSLTLPPQPPGIQGYYFRVDGLRIPDPSNLLVSSSAEFLKSYVEVPGPGPEFWSLRDVPHGRLVEVWYKNKTLGPRRVFVYTPPGFDPAATQTYPAVYLLHSTTDNETFWARVGRAPFIVDNLIADGKVKPMLLVMPFGHTSVPRGPEEGAGGKDLYDVAVIGEDLVERVMPLVEREFHASSQAQDRAIFGFAMGGYQAITIGLNHPGAFGYVVGASANFRPTMDLPANFRGLEAGLEAAKREIRYVALMTGTGEAAAIPQSQRVAQYLTTLGLRNEWATPEGGTHTWHTWRGYFRDLLEWKLFASRPYAAAPVGASRFERVVRAYEAADEASFPPRGAILLAGDSQFYRWKTFQEDLKGYTVVNRGIDSFQLSDLIDYADRIVIPYAPRMIVLHVGGNDVHNGKSPDQVLRDFKSFVAKVRARLPHVVIAFSSITPGPGRWDEAERRKATNQALKAYIARERRLAFVDLWDAMLTPEGRPREDLWVADRIHPNRAGYLLRVKLMRPLLGKPDQRAP
jgi:enterochelin esterase-like enzyme/lysophospholipase L1-like esterase